MKKILALLLALMMALSCVGVFAEEVESNEIAFELPSFTVAAVKSWSPRPPEVKVFASLCSTAPQYLQE